MQTLIKENINDLKNELSVKSKNGLDFTLAATIIWAVISFIWALDKTSYSKSILVFIVGPFLLPLAYIFSKTLKTNWKIIENPLQPLGLWFNFAQLFYFPILIFILIKNPDYFVMVYAIITGGHLFPYAWLYNTLWYAVIAGVIVVGTFILALTFQNDKIYLVPFFTSISFFILTILLYYDFLKKIKTLETGFF